MEPGAYQERQSCYQGDHSHDHEQVDHRLPEDQHGAAEGKDRAQLVPGRHGDVDAPDEQKEVTN